MDGLWLAALLSLSIGASLGLLGGGGSILTMPILIYVLGVEEKSAIATSLVVVGVTSAVAALQHARAGNVVWRVAVVFAGAGVVGAFVGARSSAFVPVRALLLLFALLMLATAAAMWRGRRQTTTAPAPSSLPKILALGVVTGLVTGLVGAGGGFLVVPALVLLAQLNVRQAVGSSLLVIALNALAGFVGHIGHVSIDGRLTVVVTGAAVAGSFIGAAAGKRVNPEKLRKVFAVFVVAMAIFMIAKQLPSL